MMMKKGHLFNLVDIIVYRQRSSSSSSSDDDDGDNADEKWNDL